MYSAMFIFKDTVSFALNLYVKDDGIMAYSGTVRKEFELILLYLYFVPFFF